MQARKHYDRLRRRVPVRVSSVPSGRVRMKPLRERRSTNAGGTDSASTSWSTVPAIMSSNVASLLQKIGAKYAEYGIDEKPFAIVKADAGTYGMGIMTVRDASEVTGLNRKQRNKMAVVKEGLSVNQVLVQEGVPTYESINEAVAEPVVYMINHFVIGGFYRAMGLYADAERVLKAAIGFGAGLVLLDEWAETLDLAEQRRGRVVATTGDGHCHGMASWWFVRSGWSRASAGEPTDSNWAHLEIPRWRC